MGSWARGVVRRARGLAEPKVAGSNPAGPTTTTQNNNILKMTNKNKLLEYGIPIITAINGPVAQLEEPVPKASGF